MSVGAIQKFHIGQKVRLIDNSLGSANCIGDVGIIRSKMYYDAIKDYIYEVYVRPSPFGIWSAQQDLIKTDFKLNNFTKLI